MEACLDELESGPAAGVAAAVCLAPHALSWTDQCFTALGNGCMESMRAMARGEVPANVVNASVLSSPAFRSKAARWKR